MEKLNKKILAFALVVAFAILMPIGNVQASLQANQNTQYKTKYKTTKWIENIRKMEATGEAMGLTETLNTDLTQSGKSNGIDVHMMRTTEYGAIAILSASGYGNPSNDIAITTTTGNNTGVMLDTTDWKSELLSGGLEGNIYLGINSRYFDTYTTDVNSARIGDALGNAKTTNPGCYKWHSATGSNWIDSRYPYFRSVYDLGGTQGIFSYDYANDSTERYSRGVAVCGEGL